MSDEVKSYMFPIFLIATSVAMAIRGWLLYKWTKMKDATFWDFLNRLGGDIHFYYWHFIPITKSDHRFFASSTQIRKLNALSILIIILWGFLLYLFLS